MSFSQQQSIQSNRRTRQQALAQGHIDVPRPELEAPTPLIGAGRSLDAPPPGKGDEKVASFIRLIRKSSRQVQNQVALHQNKQKKGGGKLTIGRTLNIVPDRVRTRLRATYLIMDATSFPKYFNLAASDLVDVAGAIGTVQPVGFDEWGAFYGSFLVMKSRLEIHFGLNSVASQAPSILSATLQGSQVTTGAFEDIPANPHAVSAAYAPGGPPGHLVLPWISHSAMFGVTDDEFRASDQFYGTTTVAPADNLYWNIVENSVVSAAHGSTLYLTMDWDVEFFDRKPLDD